MIVNHQLSHPRLYHWMRQQAPHLPSHKTWSISDGPLACLFRWLSLSQQALLAQGRKLLQRRVIEQEEVVPSWVPPSISIPWRVAGSFFPCFLHQRLHGGAHVAGNLHQQLLALPSFPGGQDLGNPLPNGPDRHDLPRLPLDQVNRLAEPVLDRGHP